MTSSIRTACAALATLLLVACTSGYQSTTQHADEGAYIRLSGNFMGTELTLNEQTPIRLQEGSTRTFRLDNERVALFEVTPGTQRVQIRREGQVVVNREVYVGRGNTIAIRVP